MRTDDYLYGLIGELISIEEYIEKLITTENTYPYIDGPEYDRIERIKKEVINILKQDFLCQVTKTKKD